ncbi:tRNA 2-selenouridine(34) synthase MnmH [Candidatus Riflebacteria bacterium]
MEVLQTANFIQNPGLFSAIDLRAPGEFQKGSIPGSINIPLFSDDERHKIGFAYKQISQQKAIDLGVQYFSVDLAEFVAKFRAVKEQNKEKKLLLYCARGGMRSEIVVSFLNNIKIPCIKLKDGYKGFRAHIVQNLEHFKLQATVLVIDGYTGTGKTILLKKLKERKKAILDLEELAQHRSSLFGAIGLKPRNQRDFEALLLLKLLELNRTDFFYVEAESRKIGFVQLPSFLATAIINSPRIFLETPLKFRASTIVDEYFDSEDKVNEIAKIIPKLQKELGKKGVERLQAWLGQKDFHKVAAYLLENYYDPRYQHNHKYRTFSRRSISKDLLESESKILEWEREIIKSIELNNPSS